MDDRNIYVFKQAEDELGEASYEAGRLICQIFVSNFEEVLLIGVLLGLLIVRLTVGLINNNNKNKGL